MPEEEWEGRGGVVRELRGRGPRRFGKRSDPSRAAGEAKRIKASRSKTHRRTEREGSDRGGARGCSLPLSSTVPSANCSPSARRHALAP